MYHPAAPAFGVAASAYPSPEQAPPDSDVNRDLEAAHQGAGADPAGKFFTAGIQTSEQGPPEACRHLGSAADQTERRLLEAMATGDRAAFSQLYFLYFLQLANFFSHVMAASAADDVEHLVVETMLRIWRASPDLARETSAHVAIMRIAYRYGSERCPADGDASPPPWPASPSRARNPASPWQSLHKTLAELPRVDRAVVHLVYSGHSRQEVADILSMSHVSVDARLASSRAALGPWLASRSPVP